MATDNGTSNIIELLRMLGWDGNQVSDFLLGVEGRISIEEAADRISRNNK